MRILAILVLAALTGAAGYFLGHRAGSGPRDRSASSSDAALATFKGGLVSEADLQAQLQSIGPQATERARTATGARELLLELVDRALLANAAKQAQLDQNPLVRARVDELLAHEYRQRVALVGTGKDDLSPEEVRTRFESLLPALSSPERARVGVIFIASTDSNRAERLVYARQVMDEVRREMKTSPEGFEAVARRRSEDPQTQPFGGQLAFASREDLAARIGDAAAAQAFAMAPGGTLHPTPLEAPKGFIILRLLERHAAAAPTLAQLEPRIRAELSAEKTRAKLEATLQTLRADAEVRIADERLTQWLAASAQPKLTGQ